MPSFLGSAVSMTGMVTLVSLGLEALVMYGLVILVIGLIAWSKYREPPLSDPYPAAKPRHELADVAGAAGASAATTVPAAGAGVAPPEQR